jgi:Fibronectin type III domain
LPTTAGMFRYRASAPSPPQDVQASGLQGAARVTWRPPVVDGGSRVRRYRVSAMRVSKGTPTRIATKLVGNSVRSVRFKVLPSGQLVQFYVTAISARGQSPPGMSKSRTIGLGANGYFLLTRNGAVIGYGSMAADGRGGVGGVTQPSPIAGMAITPGVRGYWLVNARGEVLAFGNAHNYPPASEVGPSGPSGMSGFTGAFSSPTRPSRSSGPAQPFAVPGSSPRRATLATEAERRRAVTAQVATHRPTIVGIAPAAKGLGYWVASSNGKVSAYGHAAELGSVKPGRLSAPIVAIASTAGGTGYLLVGRDGNVYPFGNARSFGSMRNRNLPAPVVAIVPSPDSLGYLLVGRGGAVYAFGDARYRGGVNVGKRSSPIVGAALGNAGGYWLAAANGAVYRFGSAEFVGDAEGRISDKVVAIATS